MVNNLCSYVMSKFLATNGFKWIDLKDFDSNKYSNNSWTGSVLGVDFEYLKESYKLNNDYHLVPDKTETNR